MSPGTVSESKKDLKEIYPKSDGKFYIRNFTDETETVLCDNKKYAQLYAETYGIEIKYEVRDDK